MRLSIAKAYEQVREFHKFLFALIEMRDFEEFIVKETGSLAERTEHGQAKEIFRRWNVQSEGHRNACQRMIEKVKEHTSNEWCITCMEDHRLSSYSWKRIVADIVMPKEGSLSVTDLYAVAKNHLAIEGAAEQRYAEMSEMTDDEEMKKMLMSLSKAEKIHHDEARMLMDTLEKTYGDKIRV